MLRKAILIEASNVVGHTDLPGARVDIDNWQTFLRSEHGGAWTTSEIAVLRKPFSSDVKAALDNGKDCYCFVAFSGHGAEGSVVLNDHYDSFPVSELKPKGDKGTLIIDSCRGITEAKQYSFSKMESFANESRTAILASNAATAESMELLEAREDRMRIAKTANASGVKWMTALKQSLNGVVEMYSCSKGEYAGEDPTSGGYYTSLLLQSADLWVKRNLVNAVHTTKDAHDYAVSKIPRQQHPQYSPLWLHFPFAASA